jgi:hypothetical protein
MRVRRQLRKQQPDAMTCAAGYQGGHDDDAVNYHASAPPAAQTTKPDAMTCAASNQGGRDDDKANYHAGVLPDAQSTKPSTDGAPEDTPRGVDDTRRYDEKTEIDPTWVHTVQTYQI